MIRRPPRSTLSSSSAASDVYKRQALTKYGENIGLAFQIVDDMLDIMQDQRDTGKPNYATKFGMKESKSESERLIKEAKDSLKIFNSKAETLKSLADYLLTRKR